MPLLAFIAISGMMRPPMKKQKHSFLRFESMFLVAGLVVVAFASLASLFGVVQNMRFIHDPIGMLYYARYFLIIGIGFVLGYLLITNEASNQPSGQKIRSGIQLSMLAYILFITLDSLRVLAQNTIGQFGYPWGKMLFEGMPLFALVIALGLYLLTHRWRRLNHQMTTPLFVIVMVLFFVSQALIFTQLVAHLPFAEISPDLLFISLLGVLVNPLVAVMTAYAVFSRMSPETERLAYAVAIGILYMILLHTVWEFRTNPAADATLLFQIITTLACVYVFAAFLVIAHKTLRYEKAKKKLRHSKKQT